MQNPSPGAIPKSLAPQRAGLRPPPPPPRAACRLPPRLHHAGARVDRRPRLPDAAAAQHALHARHDLLDLWRRHPQPARHDETLLMKAIYQFHLEFVNANVWWGDPELD